ncbi:MULTISPECIES: FRG domain-containing protein [unclassified Bradyrhizobium]|uniref:FRG domain-containing protein n=1 Tax=unclassified Bradyrhizobium TaxID=2631580 RepID=UPI0028EC3BD6|nr:MULTISPECIES: FRG domain-containing protein [unclassified Bradyrhizobium]
MSEYFNYIAFSDREYVEQASEIEMGRGRIFEYTPADIAERLKELNDSSIAFLEKLPTFLCSEIDASRSSASMVIKYGWIDKTIVGSKAVVTVFRAVIDFGEVTFSGLHQALDIFGADRFELYRTHWAVRSGDALDILEKLAELKPDRSAKIKELRTGLPVSKEKPPAPERRTIGVADNVESFLARLYELSATGTTEVFFRGHEDSSFELTPSLLRKWSNGVWQYLPNEDRLCKELLIAHHDEFLGDQYCFDQLVRMQHYGLPTRLLDISGNPLVALFFACYSTPTPLDADGEVIIFQVQSEKIKYFDSDTVSCLSNLSNLTFSQKNELNLSLDRDAFNETAVARRLLHHVKSEKGYFEGRIEPEHLRSIVCVKAKQTNMRIKSQSGAFLLFGHEASLSEAGTDDIVISRITIKEKLRILDQLNKINVNATTVYPSIDQTTARLKERYRRPLLPSSI